MIPGLDGLRAVAFLLVFFFHSDYLPFGWVGVQLFFVLSGFLITGILVNMKDTLNVRDYFVKFYGRRFLRVFPLYYFYLLAMAGLTLVLLQNHYKPNVMKLFQEQLPFALTYTYNFHYAAADYRHLYFLVHFWSLAVEEQFYIIWPLVLLMTPKTARKQVFLFLILSGPLLRILFLAGQSHSLFPALNQNPAMAIYPLTFNHLDAFACGAYIACFPLKRPTVQAIVLTFLLPASAILWQFLSTRNLPLAGSLGFEFIMPVNNQFVWGYTVLNYYFAVLILAVSKEGFLVWLLENVFLKYIGRISYGLYVYHNGLLWFAGRLRDMGLPEQFMKPVGTFAALTVSFLLAALTYHLLEKPLLDLKDRFFSTKGNGK